MRFHNGMDLWANIRIWMPLNAHKINWRITRLVSWFSLEALIQHCVQYISWLLQHYSDVVMSVMVSKSPAPRLFTQPFIQAQIKESIKVPRHCTLWGKFTTTKHDKARNICIFLGMYCNIVDDDTWCADRLRESYSLSFRGIWKASGYFLKAAGEFKYFIV